MALNLKTQFAISGMISSGGASGVASELLGTEVDQVLSSPNQGNMAMSTVMSSGSSLRDISLLRRQKAREKMGTKQSPQDATIAQLLCCEACGDNLIPNDGHMVCKSCGLCQSRDIDASQEWRNLDDNKGSDPCRVSLPNNTLMPETSMGTMVMYGGGKRSHSSHIIRTMNNWSLLTYKDSTTLKRFKDITCICKQANVLDSVIEEIKGVYHKISQVKAARRNKLQALMAVSVIIGHKNTGYEKSYKEVADMFNIDMKVLRSMIKEYELIWKEIQDEEIDKQTALAVASISELPEITTTPSHRLQHQITTISTTITEDTNTQTRLLTLTSPTQEFYYGTVDTKEKTQIETDEDFRKRQDEDNGKLKKYLIKVGMTPLYHDKVFQVNDWISEKYILAQHIPKSRYACLIYLISELYALNIDKHKIITVCDTSNVTINKCYAKLSGYLDQIIDLLDVKNTPLE